MKVFKFGGASVKDANAVKNVAKVLSSFANENVLVVIELMKSNLLLMMLNNFIIILLTNFYRKHKATHSMK
jgi:aspartate kinase